MSNLAEIRLSPRQNIIAVIFVILILLFLGLRLYFSQKALELAGPNFIVSNDDIAVMVYNTDLYRLDQSGQVLQKIPFSSLGLKNKVADIQLLDNHRFVIGDGDNQQIYLCRFAGPECVSLTENLGGEIRDFFKFAYDENRHELFIADTDNHRILYYDLSSHTVNQISKKHQFIFPNHLQVEPDGYLYITDTNHHRIAAFRFDDKTLEEVSETRVSSDVSRNRWPVFFYRQDNGDMFILQANNFLLYPDLVYIPVNQPGINFPLVTDSDITAISRMRDKLLLCDRNLFNLYQFDLNTHTISQYGGIELLNQFRQDQLTTHYQQMLSTSMLIMMVLSISGMIIFIIYLAIHGKRQATTSTTVKTGLHHNLPPIKSGQLVWIGENRMFRYLMPVFILLIILFWVLSFALTNLLDLDILHAETGSPEQAMLYMFLMMLLITVLGLVNAAFNVYTKIGTDGQHIYINRFGKEYKLDPQAMLYSQYYFIGKNLVLPYRNIFKHYFRNKAEFEAYILPLLEANSQKIRTFIDVPLYLIKHPNMLGIFNTIIFVLTCYLLYKIITVELISRVL